MVRCLVILGGSLFCWAAVIGAANADDVKPSAIAAATTTAVPESRSSTGNLEQVAYINELIRQGWEAHSLRPSPPATDGEWCRRIYLDVLGRIPTIDEVERFQREKPSERKLNLVNRLLSDEYLEEYARNWSTVFTTLLVGRPSPLNDRKTLVNRDGMQKYLRDSFAHNKPYDQMVYELVTATGANKPGEQDFQGAVNFLIGNMEENGVNATAKTAKLFLGLQVQCTQCHNHPFNDWKQNQFWELNAFFRQTKAVPQQRRGGPGTLVDLVNKDFPGENQKPDEAILFYELRNGQLKSAFPVFVDGQTISRSGKLSEVNRRDELAKLITKSNYFDLAIVNRLWGHFLGYGFTKPVDDMGPHNPPSHPELLQKLADDFNNHSHDLKQLIRWIVLSEPYGLSSRIVRGHNEKDDPALGEKPMFSHFYMRQMRAEELYESLLTATDANKSQGSLDEQEKLKTQWLKQFTIAFGTDEGDDTTTFNGTIPQTLMMFNSDIINKVTSSKEGSFLDRLAKDAKLTNAARINHLYLVTLSRTPSKAEIDWANQLLMARQGDPVGALQDVLWVVLNTSEFILNH